MIVWGVFITVILFFLALDLGVFNRKAHIIKSKEAAIWTSIWVSIALAFSGIIYWLFASEMLENPTQLTPQDAVIRYLTGYLIELSLSIDNVFVIAVIFGAFSIPPLYQHRVLFWGILGAIIFRALMIVFGVALINKFEWIIYVFGVFLLYTAYKMYKSEDTQFNPRNMFIYRQLRKVLPVVNVIHGNSFFVNRMGKRIATPLFMALIVIEFTDILFALDSIPAILSITADPFIVFSSNILAILGLRSMYFLISRMLEKFRYIHYSLVAILAFVGIKMLLSHYVHFQEWISLLIIAIALGSGIIASLVVPATPKEIPK
ncbi:TerC family protein [Aquimarina intermedia]|uniref:Tellurite resistance protein TerC n=1 Tax=Aquimarina intermedia TaxID=350814 RepID=A0A5S5C7I2_9FLAO|nr:TerC family protein [Aquimarina intermedia]TYP75257.1 tellurite resistance protein TerC [Aquimarina intermedia]